MRASRPERTDTQESRDRIIKTIGAKEMTINETIDLIFKSDVRTRKVEDRSWKYYVHLNKIFTYMERANLVKVTGSKKGPTNRTEKIWRVVC